VPEETHRHHLDAQFDGEEDEDEVIEAFEDAAARRRAHLVAARLVHAQRHAVEQDHAHADPLKPRAVSGQGVRLIQQKQGNQSQISPFAPVLPLVSHFEYTPY